jgi:acyl carrier protein
MEQKLISVVAAALGVDPELLKLDSAAGEIEAWDSVAQINIVSEVEEEFGVSIPIEKIVELHTIRDFLPYLGAK